MTGSQADGFSYICDTIPGAVAPSPNCTFTACITSNYTGTPPACTAKVLGPILSYPQIYAYGLPTDGGLAWNGVAG